MAKRHTDRSLLAAVKKMLEFAKFPLPVRVATAEEKGDVGDVGDGLAGGVILVAEGLEWFIGVGDGQGEGEDYWYAQVRSPSAAKGWGGFASLLEMDDPPPDLGCAVARVIKDVVIKRLKVGVYDD